MAQKDVIASFDGPGLLEKKPDGSYSVKPTSKGQFKVKVSAKVDGNTLPMGELQFRVKRVPDPVSTLDGSIASGNMSAQRFKQTAAVIPQLNDFPFITKFTIISYKITYINAAGDVTKFTCNQAQYDQKFRTLLDKGIIKKGSTVVFEEIFVKGPAGDRRQLAPIAVAISSN